MYMVSDSRSGIENRIKKIKKKPVIVIEMLILWFPVSLSSGPSLRAAEQRRERVQPGPHHLQGPGGALRLHPRPPLADPAGHDCPREEGRGGRQVGRESAGAWDH